MDRKHDQNKEITITELALEMRRGFQQMEKRFTGHDERFTGLETYVRDGFQGMNDKVDIVDARLEHVERDV